MDKIRIYVKHEVNYMPPGIAISHGPRYFVR